MTDKIVPLRKGKAVKITLEDAITKVVAVRPRECMVIGESQDGSEILFFHSGTTKERALWLIEQIKLLLLTGELDD